MATSYPSLEALRQAYASEPDKIAQGWTHWSQQLRSDGALEVKVTRKDGTTEVWLQPSGTLVASLQT